MKANSDFVLGNRRVACLGHVILAAFSGWQHVLFLPDSHSFAFFWVSSPLSSSLPTITRIQTQLNHPECVCVCGGGDDVKPSWSHLPPAVSVSCGMDVRAGLVPFSGEYSACPGLSREAPLPPGRLEYPQRSENNFLYCPSTNANPP